ncbi:MAG: glycosyltransferase, partial [Chitinophagaceae bacterium]
EMGFEIRLIGRRFGDSLPLGNYPFNAERIRCFFRKGFMQFAEFNIKLFFRLLFIKTDYLLANDLDALAPNYIAGKWRNKILFYDTHEYYTGVSALRNAPFKRRIWKWLEDRIFPKLKHVYTVNDSVKKKYHEEYGNEIAVIRNVPVTKTIVPLPMPEKWKGKIILLMQGMGMHPGRGGLELLEIVRQLPSNYYLVYIGGGNEWDTIAEKRLEWGLLDRVEMISKVEPALLQRYTPLAHLGMSLDGFEDLNHWFTLPNKLFDYLHAGIPVAATAIPEVKTIIEQYQCGFCFISRNPQNMAEEIMQLMNDNQRYEALRTNALEAAKELCWENERIKLTALYEPYL